MAIAYVSASNAAGQNNGSTGTATAAITPTLPAGTTDRQSRVFVVSVATGTQPAYDAAWTEVYRNVVIGSGAVSAGGGQRYMSCYFRDKTSAWTSIPAVALDSSSAPSHWVGAVAINKTGLDYTWDTPTYSSAGSDYGTANTSHSATTGNLTTHNDGFLIAASVCNDNVTMTSGALTQSGATLGTVTERCDGGTATGNDVAGKLHTCSVTTGATAALVFTGTLSGASQGGTIVIEQTESVAAGPSISTLTDDFSSTDSAKWTGYGGGVTIASGQLSIVPDSSWSTGIASQTFYNLTDASELVKVTDLGSSQVLVMQMEDPVELNGFYIFYQVPDLVMRERVAAVDDDTSVTWSGTDHVWWRIRHSGSTVYWETAPASGTPWTTRRSKTAAVSDITRLFARFIAYTSSGTTPALLDNFNLPPSSSQDVTPTGIPSGEAFGSLSVTAGSVNVTASGIASAEAFGTARLDTNVTADGVASAETFGISRVDLNLTTSGIASTEAHGSHTVSVSAASVTPTGIATAESFGAHTVTAGAVSVTAAGIATDEAFGAHSVSVGAISITATGITSGEVFGAHSISAGAVDTSPTGIASGETFGSPSVSVGAASVSPSGIASAEVVAAPSVLPGPVDVTVTGIASAEAFGVPAVTTGAVSITATGIESVETLGLPVLVDDSLTLIFTGISSGEAFGDAAVTTGPVSVTATGIPSSEAFGTADVQAGGATVTPSGIASGEALGNPTVTTAAAVTPSGIASGEAFGNPAIETAPVDVTPTGIPSGETFGAPELTLVYVITADGIPSGETFGTVTVAAGVNVIPAGIPSTELFGLPRIEGGQIFLPPDDRTYRVPPDVRAYRTPVDARAYRVPPDDRRAYQTT